MRKTRSWLFWPFFVLLALAGLVLPASAAEGQVVVLSIEGPITPAMVNYFERGIATAEREGAQAVVIQLDTPGGQVDLTLEIVQLLRAARLPIIVYIAPRGAQAASAGAIITLAAHASAMAPETVIGAASPVGAEGADLEETMERKAIEDLKATVRSLAERRGEEAIALAEAMVEEARAVHSQEALEAGLIDLVADDVRDVLDELDGMTVEVGGEEMVLTTAGAAVEDTPPNLLEQVLHTVVNPAIVALLIAIGVQAILIELSSPGGWVAGFIGVIFLALGIYGLGILPVNWLGLGLIAVAFVLFLMDIKAPTHGALTVVGIATLVIGFLILFNSPGSPDFARISIPIVVGISLLTGAFFAFVIAKALRAQQRPPITGMEALIGETAKVRTSLTPEGTVFLAGELWRAVSEDGSELPAGESVQVVAADDLTLFVRPVDNER